MRTLNMIPDLRAVGLMMVLLLGLLTSARAQSNRIEFNGHDLFLSGGNIAWVRYGSDVGGSPNGISNDDLNRFNEIFQDVKVNHGNSVRLFIHAEGVHTPEWGNDNRASGLNAYTISDLEKILDKAWDSKIGVILTLWNYRMVLYDQNKDDVYVDRAYTLVLLGGSSYLF